MPYPSDSRALHALGFYDRIMLAIVTGVNIDQGTMSISFVDQYESRDGVPFPIIAMTSNGWIRFIPSVNDVVIVGIRPDDQAIAIAYYPWAYRTRTVGYDNHDVNQVSRQGPELMQKLQSGEYDMRSSGGAYVRGTNKGDLYLLGVSGGGLHLYGMEGITEVQGSHLRYVSALATLRVGMPFRDFPIFPRPQIASGAGTPTPTPNPADVEYSLELPFAQLRMSSAMNQNGVYILSGGVGNGFITTNPVNDIGRIRAVQVTTAIQGISPHSQDVAQVVSGKVGGQAFTSIGLPGEPLSYSLRTFTTPAVNTPNPTQQSPPQVLASATEISRTGSMVVVTSSPEGMHFTSAFGNIDMMAAKNATRTALFVTDLATTASRAADNSIVDIAETTAHRAAGQTIEDYTPNGQYNLQANQVTITVGGVGITVTSTGPIAISSSGAVTINATGPVNVTSAGPVTIQGNPVAIN